MTCHYLAVMSGPHMTETPLTLGEVPSSGWGSDQSSSPTSPDMEGWPGRSSCLGQGIVSAVCHPSRIDTD